MSNVDLTAAARTLVNAAEHLARLKSDALALHAATDGAAARGYFTPSEDEQIRHQLVSYAHWRAALFALVYSLTDHLAEIDPDRADDPDRFVPAFAAGLLLVDAARFLRDTWDRDTLTVRKLNEAEPHFGIEAGTYDRVQHSLTDPYHAWALYRASAFYERAEPMLRERGASDPAMGALLELTASLAERVRVGKRAYLMARLRVRGRQVNREITGGPLLRAAYAIQESVSRMCAHISVRPSHRPSLPAAVREALAPLLRPGDVMIVRKEHAITNYFLPGYWPHAAMYLGTADDLRRLGLDAHANVRPRWERLDIADAERRRVLEAMADGVLLRGVDSPFAADAITVIRPMLDPAAVGDAIARGMFHEGKSYDFDFDFTRSDRLVCTEVVYRSYEGVGAMRFALTRRAGRMTLAAEDLLAMARRRECFEPVACYCPIAGAAVHHGDAVDTVLDATLGR